MEERSQTQRGDDEFPRNQTTTNNDDISHRDSLAIPVCNTDKLPSFASGTYVVQVPKDQIYRVPPPENALIAENYRNQKQQRGSSRAFCSSRRCIRVVVTLVVVGIIIGLVIGLNKLFTKHDDPQFSVKQVLVKKFQKNQPNKGPQYQYNITIEATNPNQRSRILYNYKGDGDISLYFKQKEIGRWNFPDLVQDPKSSTDFEVILGNGDIDKLSEEVERSINSTNSNQRLSLSLSMVVPIKFKVWGISSKNKNIRVSCSLTMNTLTKNSHVNNQKCLSK